MYDCITLYKKDYMNGQFDFLVFTPIMNTVL